MSQIQKILILLAICGSVFVLVICSIKSQNQYLLPPRTVINTAQTEEIAQKQDKQPQKQEPAAKQSPVEKIIRGTADGITRAAPDITDGIIGLFNR